MRRVVIAALAAALLAAPAAAAQWNIAVINPTTGVAERVPVAEGWTAYYDDAANSWYFFKPGSYGIPAFRISAAGKIEGLSLQLYEQGDAVDLNIGRAGPDNVQDGNLQTTQPGARIGQLCFQTYVTGVGWGASSGYACSAQVAGRADGTQTATSRPGYLELRATRAGSAVVETNVEVHVHNRAAVGSTGVRVRWTETVNQDGVMDYLVIGPPNSCGSGFRCVRVPN